MEELFRYLTSLAPMPAELQAALISRTEKTNARRNKTLLATGQVCDWIGFVESGLVKVGYDVPSAEERIVLFASTGTVAFSAGSFATGQPSKVSVVAIEETVLRKIRKAQIDDLCHQHPGFHLHIRKIMESQTLLLEEHYMRQTIQQRERYNQLLQSDSWLVRDRRIKDYMVAAFLGMDRSTFSRLRNGKI